MEPWKSTSTDINMHIMGPQVECSLSKYPSQLQPRTGAGVFRVLSIHEMSSIRIMVYFYSVLVLRLPLHFQKTTKQNDSRVASQICPIPAG